MQQVINEISRGNFRAAIEAGIKSSPNLNDIQKYRLRSIGIQKDEASWGTFKNCPATQAGLDRKEWLTVAFSKGFDGWLVNNIESMSSRLSGNFTIND